MIKERWNDHFSIGTVYGEIFRNFKRIGRISIHDFYRRNKDTRLGFLWNILTPLIQVLIYWFVFGIGLRSGKPIAQGGTQYDYLVWLFTGLFTFQSHHRGFYTRLRGAIIDGANCIYVKYSLISKMKIPLSILSVTSVLTALLMSLPSFAIVFLFLLLNGSFAALPQLVNLLYFIAASVLHFIGLSLVTSALSMVSRDFHRLLTSFMRVFMFLSPIFWSMEHMPEWSRIYLKLNPLYHLMDIFRAGCLTGYAAHPLLGAHGSVSRCRSGDPYEIPLKFPLFCTALNG